MGGIKAEGTRDAVSSGTSNVKFQEAIVVPLPPHGEFFVAVRGERVVAVGVDEEHFPRSERDVGGSIPVKLTIEFFVRGKFVVVARGAEHVERVLHLWQHLTPQWYRTLVSQRGNVYNDVVFRCFHRWFGRVNFMVVRLHVLSCGAFLDQEVLNSAGAFIVEEMEFWLVSYCFQSSVNAGEYLHHAGIFPRFHGALKNRV